MFVGCKDKFKARLMAKSDALVVTELQACRQEPVARFEDALVRAPVLPELKPDATDAEKGTGYYGLSLRPVEKAK
ncbi:uncharacterized protein IUM83_00530 [Phytophthora cinnamomi]|uniref:uncharacterized protein n=1 Tax=Phytophthora cinnamomi TaxID=4785 RepID=UPI00355A09D8|nr:hypothetical protein IUM83_00530 [Phytophthora cinnamomi]